MVKFPLNGGSYTSQSVNADCQRTVNWYPERVETDGTVVSYPTPGLKLFADFTSGGGFNAIPPCGGLFPAPNGKLFGIVNDSVVPSLFLADIDSVGNVFLASNIGLEQVTDTPVSLVFSNTEAAFATPTNGIVAYFDYTAIPAVMNLAMWTTTGQVSDMAQVVYMSGYFLALKKDTNQVFYTLNIALWDPLDVFEVSITSDRVKRMTVDHGELWLSGEIDTTVYVLTADPNDPFQPNQSGFIQQGIAAPSSMVQLDNTLMWIGGDTRGSGIGWRANGYTPQRITNHAVEFAWQGYSRIDDAVAFPYQDQGHSFWHIYFPTAGKTWVYDVATQLWHERSHLNDGSEEAHLAWVHAFAFGKHFVGSWKNTNIYQMKIPTSNGSGGWDFVTDNGDLIKRTRRASAISANQKRMNFRELQVYLESGLGPIPPLTSNLAAPVLGAQAGGALAAGLYVGRFALISGSDTQSISDESSVTIAATQALAVTTPTETIGWRFYVSNDGWTTAYYYDITVASTTRIQGFGTINPAPFIPDWTLGQRAPQLMVRWSNNATHTWSNEYMLDCGKAGEFDTRVILRRLGQGRNRVFEISATDPIPWRIISGFVLAEECDS